MHFGATTDTIPRMRQRPDPVLLVLFFLSGASSLTYEIVWTRLFTVVIGNTVFSVSAILSVFMTGLALGSRLAGRYVDRRNVPLTRIYALLEAGIGIFNLLLPVLLKMSTPIFGALYSSAYQSTMLLGIARFLLSFALLILPATLIGATLPVLIRFYVATIDDVGAQTGRVYAINTLGAALGAVLAGFVLIPRAGTMFALYSAAFCNLGIALVAWQRGQGVRPLVPSENEGAESKSGPPLVVIAMFLSGFAALLNEVAWTRVLALIAGPTTYAFTFMLCSMILGLATGAAIGAAWARRYGANLSTFAWIEAGVGGASLALIPAFGRLPLVIASLVRGYSGSIQTIQSTEFLIFFGLMLAPTIFLGMTFPIASRLYAKSDLSLGTDVSAIYAANTAGGIIGSFIAGFLLIPAAGSQSTLVLAALLSAMIGIFVASADQRWAPAACCVAIAVAGLFMPRWNPELISSGAYKYAPMYAAHTDLESMLTSGDLLYFKEGAATTVSVRKYRGTTALSVDGKVDATDAGDMTTQKMLAHLPLLFTEEAKNVAIIGLGSGVTAASALEHPIEKMDVIEISREVVEAAKLFAHVNHNALADRRVELIVGDGRNHLRYTKRKYDVIVSEPSNPWMSGMASLFTQEFFAESRARLTDRGIHCQWFHSYNMSLDDLRTVIATFRTVFPHALLWTLNEYDFLLLGSVSSFSIDETVFKRNFERVGKDLAQIKVQDPYTILSSLILRESELDQFSRNATLNTDNYPTLEFSAPLSIYADTTNQNLAALMSLSSRSEVPRTADQHRQKGEALTAAEAFNAAVKEFHAAVALDVKQPGAWKGLVEAAKGADRAKVEQIFETALGINPINVVRLAAADFYSQQGHYQKTVDLRRAVLESEPDNVDALEKLADALAEQGSDNLAATVDRLLRISPDNSVGLYHFATIRLYQNRFDEAIQAAKRSLEYDSKSSRTRNVVAIAYERTFQPDLAEAEFRRAIEEAPEDWVAYNNYGIFLLGRNRPSDALQQFQRAIRLNPENILGFAGMSEALQRSGRKREADIWEQKALRLQSRGSR
jgi:spermidine synthase